MIADFDSSGSATDYRTAVCIVGSGAAGITIAHELARAGKDVVLVESGGLARSPPAEALNIGESVGVAHTGLVDGRARLFGGATRIWAGQCVPLDEWDFEPRDWVPHSGWPLSKSELGPYYARAEVMLDIAGARYDESNWLTFGVRPPPLDASVLRHRFTVMMPKPDLGRRFHATFRRARNLLLLLHATATGVRLNESGSTVAWVDVATMSGRRGRVRADAVVLCCGGIDNARLLLLSNDVVPGGVGNQNGLVGRFFQDHPNSRTAALFTDAPRPIQERYSLFYRRGVRLFPKIQLSPDSQRRLRTLNCVAHPVYDFGTGSATESLRHLTRGLRRRERSPEYLSDLVRVLGHAPGTLGLAWRRYARGRSSIARPASVALQVHTEHAPNPDSRITLSTDRDVLGQPRARVAWRLGELERWTAQQMAEAVAGEFGRLRLGAVRPADWIGEPEEWSLHVADSYHHIGGTRMSHEPSRGVVDRDCRVHGVADLYVAGSSVFPTSGFANPTLTIVALALRLADHLRSTLR